VLPNLILIGASRCGTTSLHRYLDLHPQISMSRTKELNFFVEERNWPRGVGWYESQFADTAPVRGEASPHYTACERFDGVPERMAAVIPEAKLVYLVRDPIARAFSAYSVTRAIGLDERPPEQALLEDFNDGFYLGEGRYWMQLERYLEHFPAGRVAIVDQHELMHRRRDALAELFRFLGVDDRFDSSEFDVEHNPTPPVPRNRLGAASVAFLNRVLGRDRSLRLRSALPSFVRRPFARGDAPKPTIDDALRERLVAYFQRDVDELRRFSGMDFVGWSL
jgi:hypothetical protein